MECITARYETPGIEAHLEGARRAFFRVSPDQVDPETIWIETIAFAPIRRSSCAF